MAHKTRKSKSKLSLVSICTSDLRNRQTIQSHVELTTHADIELDFLSIARVILLS